MKKLLEHTRRPDISFNRNGTIRITARVARILSLCPGDTINIAVSNGGNPDQPAHGATRTSPAEYLLYATHHVNNTGRHEAQCYPTKTGSKNFCANSVRLCRSLLDSVGVKADKASFMIGEAFERGDTTYLAIITRQSL